MVLRMWHVYRRAPTGLSRPADITRDYAKCGTCVPHFLHRCARRIIRRYVSGLASACGTASVPLRSAGCAVRAGCAHIHVRALRPGSRVARGPASPLRCVHRHALASARAQVAPRHPARRCSAARFRRCSRAAALCWHCFVACTRLRVDAAQVFVVSPATRRSAGTEDAASIDSHTLKTRRPP